MKLGASILLIPSAMTFPSFLSDQTLSAQIWLASFQQSLQNLIDNPLRRSTIPQFILDTRHPWILLNQRKLENLFNAEAFLCGSPDSEPKESTGIETEIPPDLFDNLEINNVRAGISRPGWPNALERLGEMKRCQRALEHVKTLEVDIYIHRESYPGHYLNILEPAQPPKQLLTLFRDVLQSMTNLETLIWGIPKEDAYFFEEAFKLQNFTLSSVKFLKPSPSSYYMVGSCPNVERIENNGRVMWHRRGDEELRLIHATASTPKLKRFAIDTKWTPSLISEVLNSMPQIESLGLFGAIGTNTGDEGGLKPILDLLIGLKTLTHLDLTGSADLGLGFEGGPGCGNFYDGKVGRMYQRQVTKEEAEATERGGDIVVASLPHLTSFTIGGTKPNITIGKDGMVIITWPWTGRMDAWLMEVVPEQFDSEDEYEG